MLGINAQLSGSLCTVYSLIQQEEKKQQLFQTPWSLIRSHTSGDAAEKEAEAQCYHGTKSAFPPSDPFGKKVIFLQEQ